MNYDHVCRIGVFKLRNIGDVLLMTPALRSLREIFPRARITAIVYSGTEAMLAHNPHVDEILIYAQASRGWNPLRRLIYELGFFWQLLRHRFDLTIGFTLSERTTWYSLFLGWAGTPWRVGWQNHRWTEKDLRRRAFTHTVSKPLDEKHEVEKHRLLLEAGNITTGSKISGPLCLVIPEPLRVWARAELAPLRVTGSHVVLVHPVSRWLWKCWGNKAVAAVIDWLQRERQTRVVLTTGPTPRERRKAQEILALCQTRPLFYDGSVTLTQLAALIAEVDLFFGVDTAPMHIAAAVGTPIVALFGPAGTVAWLPWTEKKIILSHPCHCSSAPQGDCSWEQNDVRSCLAAITVEEVAQAMDTLISNAPARL